MMSAVCLANLAENSQSAGFVKELAAALQEAGKNDADRIPYDCLRNWAREGASGATSSSSGGWCQHEVCGVPLCHHAVCSVLSMSRSLYWKLRKHLAQGYLDPAGDLSSSGATGVNANTLLAWVHQRLAESLVESADYLLAAK